MGDDGPRADEIERAVVEADGEVRQARIDQLFAEDALSAWLDSLTDEPPLAGG